VLERPMPMPLGFPAGAVRSGLAYVPGDDDLFVASYPKCGTTWVQHIVWLLMHEAQALSPNESLTELFPHLEEVGREGIAAMAPPRLIKTHLPFSATPFSARAKYVYVARNPFDCCASFFHHTRGFVKHYDFADGTFDEFFDCFVEGEVDFGDYFDNVLGWLAQRDAENVFWVTYEALKADPHGEVRRIGEFIGGDAARLIGDTRGLDEIVEASSFERMSTDQQRWSSQRPDDMPAFVRKGVVGDWANYFTPVQTERMLRRIAERSPAGEIEALWPDILDAAREFARA
jgi:hypothetical protein